MKNWEFLLQREGDTTWLPLETADVEILEGRYRVVARSGYRNAKIEVRITHHALEETPPVRRVQTRTTNTSDEGLMVVLPYTRLRPGIWELSCSPHTGQALINPYSDNLVKLRVLSSESELLEDSLDLDPAPPSDSDADGENIEEEAVEISDGRDRDQAPEPDAAEKLVVEIIDQRNTDPETSPPQTQPKEVISVISDDSPAPEESQPAEELPPPELAIAPDGSAFGETEVKSLETDDSQPVRSQSPLEGPGVDVDVDADVEVDQIQLALEQDTFVAKLGQVLLISGRVEAAESSRPSNVESARLSPDRPHLEIYLRDPHNSSILLHVQRAIPQLTLPMPFSCAIYIPFECQTRLILGEIGITLGGESVTRHPFTIATQVEHLLEAIGTEFGASEDTDITLEEDQPDGEDRPKTRLQLIDPNAISAEEPELSESEGSTLPPVIQPSSPTPKLEAPSLSSLQLPKFGDLISEHPDQPAEASPQPSPGDILTPGDESSAEPIFSETDYSESEGGQLVPVSPTDPAFQALNLQNRFWSRLNALAQDQDLSQWMKKAKPVPFPDTSFVQTRPSQTPQPPVPEPPGDAEPLFPSFDDDLESQEIVVDDEPQPETPPASSASRQLTLRLLGSNLSQSPVSEGSGALSEDEPIPPPILEVMNSEIIAGRTVKVRVCMADNLPRIYVKIWVYDRQSRSIVDGPRWLTEFLPNGLSQIETTVNLEIAYGSLEVQFEAIAVEMQTQRESHKVIVERSVVPPAAPTLPLDEE